MMIYGALFGCTDPLLTLAASMSARSPFVSPFDQREQADQARKKFAEGSSDHLTILNAFNQWSELKKSQGNRAVVLFLKENFLGRMTLKQMEDLRKQFHSLLTDIGFLPQNFQLNDKEHAANANSSNKGLLNAALCAGLYPNILVAPKSAVSSAPPKPSDKKMGETALRSHTKGDVYLHPSTVAFEASRLDSRYCCYYELVRTSKTYVRDCTPVSPFALLLFGGSLQVYQTHGVCSIDGWLKFRIDAKPATLIKYLRSKMERLLFEKIVAPEKDIMGTVESKALINSISLLFESEASEQRPIPETIPDRSGGEIVRPYNINEDRNSRSAGRAGRGRGGHGGRGRGRSSRGDSDRRRGN
jgi:HrpA-like RNA helicase